MRTRPRKATGPSGTSNSLRLARDVWVTCRARSARGADGRLKSRRFFALLPVQTSFPFHDVGLSFFRWRCACGQVFSGLLALLNAVGLPDLSGSLSDTMHPLLRPLRLRDRREAT